METEWRELPFSEAVIINPTVALSKREYYPFVDMKAVEPSNKYATSSQEREFDGSGSRFQSGDTLMARITPCLENGKIAQFRGKTDNTFGHGSTEFIVLRGRPDISDTDFVYYLTKWDEVRYYAISQMTGTSGRQRVPTESLQHLFIRLPSLAEQKAIAHILGTLDDKIELNRRMNETLEGIARAIFKSWFIDFDPVRAKAEGRDPGLPKPIADLFPNRFIDSKLGKIPEGWRISKMGDEFRIVMGQSPPGYTYNEVGEGAPFYQGRVDFGVRFPSRRVYCTMPTRFAETGDTLVTVRAPVGDTNIAVERCCIGRGLAAIRHTTGSSTYTYYFVQSLRAVFQTFESEGTVFGAINKEGFKSILCIAPPKQVVECFNNLCKPIDDAIWTNELETRILSSLRDVLLPELISGRIRVKEPERLIKGRDKC